MVPIPYTSVHIIYIDLFFKMLSILQMSVRKFQCQRGLFRWSCDLWVYIFARLLHFITWYLDYPLAESTLNKFSWSPNDLQESDVVFFKYSRVLELFKEVEPCELVNVHVFGMDPLFFVGQCSIMHAACFLVNRQNVLVLLFFKTFCPLWFPGSCSLHALPTIQDVFRSFCIFAFLEGNL